MNRLFYGICSMLFSGTVLAQGSVAITNADGSALTTRYCHQDVEVQLLGSPAGGTFSGCSMRFENGQWLFNPALATQGVTVFPMQCAVVYTAPHGQSVSRNILVQKPVVIDPPLQDIGLCVDTFQLQVAMLYAGAYDYAWNPAAPLERPDTSTTKGTVQQTTLFRVRATDRTSGCVGEDSILVTRHPMPQLSVDPASALINSRGAVQLNATGADHYVWSPNEGLNDPAIAAPIAQPRQPTTYRVVGYNEFECTDTAYVPIDINETLLLPNAFTPNGDGKNDHFAVKNMGYQGVITFKIYDRWGRMIFETMDAAKGWDGSHAGRPAPQGVYYYHIQIGLRDSTVKDLRGDVMLIR